MSLRKFMIIWVLRLLIRRLRNKEVAIDGDFKNELARIEMLAIMSEENLRETLPELAIKFDNLEQSGIMSCGNSV